MPDITPLEYRRFFSGVWSGDGELRPTFPFRLWMRDERFRFHSETEWISNIEWIARDRMEFASGRNIERTMFVRKVAADRLHMTAEDMPHGADIHLRENGFFFSPYIILAEQRGQTVMLRCLDENIIDQDGVIHDTIRMFFLGIPVATMTMRVTIDRQGHDIPIKRLGECSSLSGEPT